MIVKLIIKKYIFIEKLYIYLYNFNKKRIEKDNGISYEDDMYLDVVVTPSGDVILLDENELKEAFYKKEKTKNEYDELYKIAYNLMEKLKGNKEKLQKYTKDVIRFKILIIFSMIMWLVYDLYIKSYTSGVFDFMSVIANLISIFQIKRCNIIKKNGE